MDRTLTVGNHNVFSFSKKETLQYGKLVIITIIGNVYAFIHVLWRSVSSYAETTSSTKYFVGLKWLELKCCSCWGTGDLESRALIPEPASSIASKYPLIHSFPAIWIECLQVLILSYLAGSLQLYIYIYITLLDSQQRWRINSRDNYNMQIESICLDGIDWLQRGKNISILVKS